MRKFSVILIPNDPLKGYTVRVPALPGCVTYGATRREALKRAQEAVLGFVEAMARAGDPIPEQTRPVEVYQVQTP